MRGVWIGTLYKLLGRIETTDSYNIVIPKDYEFS